jgi:hypothetical protein
MGPARPRAYLREISTGTCPSCGLVVDLGTLTVEGDVWTFGAGAAPGAAPLPSRVCVALAPASGPGHRRFWLEQVPGEGVEPSRPHRGQLILSQPRMSSFATPAVEQRSPPSSAGQVPGWFIDTAVPSGPLPRNASRNVLKASSSKRGHVATCPIP